VNHWRRQVEDREQINIQEGEVKDDSFKNLIRATDHTRGAARVSVTWGRAGEFSNPKVSVTITVTCDQDEETIDKAGFLAYSKATELVDEVIKTTEGVSG
jgi:hypothetical protein